MSAFPESLMSGLPDFGGDSPKPASPAFQPFQPQPQQQPAAMPSLLSSQPAPAAKPPVELRSFRDVRSARESIYNRVFDVASKLQPVTNQTHTLKLSGVHWGDNADYSKADRKRAVLAGETLGRRLRGTWELYDNASGQLIDKKMATVAKIPYLTDSGTFVYRGNEYALRNQQRLRPGIFVREKANGEIEAHVNVLANGPAHRYFLDPARGVFYARLGQANIPLLPLLDAMGASADEIKEAWGSDLYALNYSKADPSALDKLAEKILPSRDDRPVGQQLREAFEKMTLDPEVTTRTLGSPFGALNKDAILATTAKLLKVSRKEAEVDDRDHLGYQVFVGPEDLFSERLEKDRAGLQRMLLFKAVGKGGVQHIGAGALQDQIDSAITESGLGVPLEEINPAEILDKLSQMTRMGEGGISNFDAIPEEARSVQPSYANFVDPLRTPESSRAGVDVYMASNTKKGSDGRIYSEFIDAKTGKKTWKSPQDVIDSVIGFSDTMSQQGNRVPAFRQGRLTYVPKQEIDFIMPNAENAFSPLGNLVPLKSMVKGQRVAMASRMTTQALPLENPEAPLVQSAVPGTNGQRSFEEEYSPYMGAIRADAGGRVVSMTDDALRVRYDDGRLDTIELYRDQPYNRKSGQTQTPAVQVGQRFSPGQLLVRSNYTDKDGTTALGLNARVAFVPWGGANFEDAFVISESMAKRFTSQHMYQHQLEKTDRTRIGTNAYVSLFPSRFDKATLAKLTPEGVVKPGTVVNYGDPLVVGVEERAHTQNKLHKKRQAGFNDVSVTWEHSDPGIVTDVVLDAKGGPVVLVKSTHAMQIGDKFSNRYGSKGVVSAIVPDAQMPHDKDGQAFEVLANPLGIISRTNPSQVPETVLGKLAKKLGRAIKVDDFDPNITDRTAWAIELAKQHGVSDTDDIIDPSTGNKIPGVLNGYQFFMKLHHTAEGKEQGRGGGAYSSDETPAKGGVTGSKRMGLLESNALLSHGATEVLRDAHVVRGQRNDEYWLQFMQGVTPRAPRVPLVYNKFVNELKASGINVVRQGSAMNIMALTDKDIDQLAGDRNIASGETVKVDEDLAPVAGGLFDKGMTGGHHGTQWAAIKLEEPMPNPVMEEPIRRLLGLTQQKFEDVLAGKEKLGNGESGPAGIAAALKDINVDRELERARAQVAGTNKTARDAAIRRLGYLKSAKRLGIHPSEWMLTRAPVLPPQFRPISLMHGKNVPLVADANYLYRELIEANKNLTEIKKSAGPDSAGNERLAVYNAFKAVTGLGDPITQQSQERQIKGILANIFGNSPKYSTVQRKLLSATTDNVGRAVITPNPDLDMDTIGLPEDKAFDVYSRFLVRRLRRSGLPVLEAMRHIKDRTPLARKTLVEEMQDRPVIANRAPVLHRFGVMAFRPVLTAGSTVQVSPLVVKGFNADFDGDTMQYHVPVEETARKEALERMLPSRQLISPADFKTPVHVPGQEYVAGLFHATSEKRDRPPQVFRNAADVRKAWLQGRIGISDQVKILDHT